VIVRCSGCGFEVPWDEIGRALMEEHRKECKGPAEALRALGFEERYFLTRPGGVEHEVTQEEFVAAELEAGFHPKAGLGPVATAGFESSAGVRGRVLERIAGGEWR
jgi:hypothetical protein